MKSSKKIGRNASCWCGSGEKFKYCHLNRERDEKPKHWETAAEFRSLFSAEYCSAPDAWHHECDKKIVRAHTVPKSSSLSKIARNGHVLAFVPTLENIAKNHGRLLPVSRGVNQASTFNGFCKKHDNDIFSPIENYDFIGTPEQCFLLAYRANAREIYTKKAQSKTQNLMKSADRGRNIEQQKSIQLTAFLHSLGTNAGVSDNDYHKKEFDKTLIAKDFSGVRSYILFFRDAPDVMCSASYFPDEDFDGDRLQDLSDFSKIANAITFSSFWSGHCGVVVFSWLENSDPVCKRFIETLDHKSDKEIPNALIRFFFEVTENVQLCPEWWESLTQVTRDCLIDRMARSANPYRSQPVHALKDDGLNYVDWHLSERRRVGF